MIVNGIKYVPAFPVSFYHRFAKTNGYVTFESLNLSYYTSEKGKVEQDFPFDYFLNEENNWQVLTPRQLAILQESFPKYFVPVDKNPYVGKYAYIVWPNVNEGHRYFISGEEDGSYQWDKQMDLFGFIGNPMWRPVSEKEATGRVTPKYTFPVYLVPIKPSLNEAYWVFRDEGFGVQVLKDGREEQSYERFNWYVTGTGRYVWRQVTKEEAEATVEKKENFPVRFVYIGKRITNPAVKHLDCAYMVFETNNSGYWISTENKKWPIVGHSIRNIRSDTNYLEIH